MTDSPRSSLGPPPRPSLAQQCGNIIQALYSLHFDHYLFPCAITDLIEPVSTLWDCLRLGAPLCELYNGLGLKPELAVPDVSDVPQGGANNHKCKAATYKFLVACKDHLSLEDDQRFDLRDLYNDDTNGLVKVLKTVEIILAKLAHRTRALQRRFQAPCHIRTFADRTILYLLTRRVTIIPEHGDLLDFQRKFLVQLESCLSRSRDEQRIGRVFLENAVGFRVYGPYCINYMDVNEKLPLHTGALQPLANIIEPTRGLPSHLIKPVQRLAKYPLLLKQLITFSEGTGYPYIEELGRAEKCCSGIAEMINEAQRMEELRRLRDKLTESLEDWKGLDIRDFGDLQLADKFLMESHDIEREYHLFLFDKIFVCCKEVPGQTRQPKKAAGSRTNSTEAVEKFRLKGNIYIQSIVAVKDTTSGFRVHWQDGPEMETFSVKVLNGEQKKLWMERLIKLVVAAKRSSTDRTIKYTRRRESLIPKES
ncbi:hypothetical protein SeMB42_g05900 [Synchytrium endobioticum]|uniref:DH domain-containing protein n=1 Tax=Synchytrium endobioticum TaxID=286115 RepID=A0A507CSZ3_9FUNG|nr:hypothetical protein SeMB42_g05900 [Synchytrium endobioticum]TPX42181.1 hypothetical protein SeLEV6574_g05720 [Synchytrium endobioticum]